MTSKKRHKSTLARIRRVREITEAHYEPGNQSRSYRAVWRRWVYPELAICFRTYMEYIGAKKELEARDGMRGLFD